MRRGFQPCLRSIPKRAGFFQQRSLARDRIFGAVDPGVMMIAANDPFVGRDAAGNLGDDVVHRFEVPIEFDFQMNLRRARAT